MTQVVIIDDEIKIVHFLVEFFETMYEDWEVFGFTHPKDVLDTVNETNFRIDLLVTDFKMPEINGAELIRTIKKKKPQVKAICMSGLEKKVVCDLNGCDDFILKPFKLEDFKEKVDKLFPPSK